MITSNLVNGSASIRYSIPAGSSSQFLVLDIAGRQVKVLSLKGGGTLNLSASVMAGSVYSYSLVFDGKKVHTENITVIR